MPIAHCVTALTLPEGAPDPVERWAEASGFSAEHMTLYTVVPTQCFGKAYAIMVTLYLPTLWSEAQVERLQLGLVDALAQCFATDIAGIQVITQYVESGHAVEAGRVERW